MWVHYLRTEGAALAESSVATLVRAGDDSLPSQLCSPLHAVPQHLEVEHMLADDLLRPTPPAVGALSFQPLQLEQAFGTTGAASSSSGLCAASAETEHDSTDSDADSDYVGSMDSVHSPMLDPPASDSPSAGWSQFRR